MVGLSVLLGNFFGGGGLVSQLEKVSIAVDTTCSAKSNSGFDENHQGAVAVVDQSVVLVHLTVSLPSAVVVSAPDFHLSRRNCLLSRLFGLPMDKNSAGAT